MMALTVWAGDHLHTNLPEFAQAIRGDRPAAERRAAAAEIN
jgi:hypothetical protein